MVSRALLVCCALSALFCSLPWAQELPDKLPSKEELANDNKLFITLAGKALKWEEPAEPVHIGGPLYFVGTKGLGAFLFATPDGHLLMNTGMPSSGPMILDSVRKLGFKPQDIKLLIASHAHIDHAGAMQYIKKQTGAELALMEEEARLAENGGKGDFRYGDEFAYPPVKVDRLLTDGDSIHMGNVLLTAHHTPGHTRGATTWLANIEVDGKAYLVAFPDGAGFNPGYHLEKQPSYPGIADDYRRTHHFLEMLKPDIWLAQHNEYYDLAGKTQRAQTEGIKAWLDLEGYRRFIAKKKRAFEEEVDTEMGVTPSRK